MDLDKQEIYRLVQFLNQEEGVKEYAMPSKEEFQLLKEKMLKEQQVKNGK